VAKQSKYHLGIEIDRLINSIVNTISGDSFPTDVHPLSTADLKTTLKRMVGFLIGQVNLS
jgi:hypothetical protein